MVTAQQPSPSTADRGPRLTAIYWSMSLVAITTVGLRFWGRFLIRQTGADDWVMLFTLVSVRSILRSIPSLR
jgi:hypothetical protein